MSANPLPIQPGFDLYDHAINWQPFAGIENLELTLCDLDEERSVVDLLVRFAPNKTVTMHNHLAQTNMFIIQGELRMYEPDGSTREVRPAGSYYRGTTGDAHSEGGGPEGAVVFYSMRCDGERNVLEILEDSGNVQATLTMDDVRAAWAAQQAL
ncbi:MAG: cupin domain-containing protein [Proteobacteria bacterium]|nr:cupin domain-containing protein [Pseudomonadota bacterium]